ncbi:hypothetical protein IE81DRAFT_325317 [Ceraceosorus guamensis]|uniref:Uncharacterized protein n=1 Tax=Ceraceosorus guamensis TaxID=1522189 RepID=A0A316VWA2_9BASI|nr:hypothetical protein IE81DRAFT_325317 [Ceraceosorus guamensis]PWN40713.1 hypothetical protein IE81DRAFT_325317 [Ceraceosorus guamensis]
MGHISDIRWKDSPLELVPSGVICAVDVVGATVKVGFSIHSGFRVERVSKER